MFLHKSWLLYGVLMLIQLLSGMDFARASDTGVVQIPGDSMMSCVARSLVTNRDISRVAWCPEPGACYTYTEDNRPEGVGCTCFEELERIKPRKGMSKTFLRYTEAGCSTVSTTTTPKMTTPKTSTSNKPTNPKSTTPKTSTSNKPTNPKSTTPKTSTSNKPTNPKSTTPKTSTSNKPTTPQTSTTSKTPKSSKRTTSKSTTSKTSTTSKPTTTKATTSKTSTTSKPTTSKSTTSKTSTTSKPTTSKSTTSKTSTTSKPTTTKSTTSKTSTTPKPTSSKSTTSKTSTTSKPTTTKSTTSKTSTTISPTKLKTTPPITSTTYAEPTWQIVFKAVAGTGQSVYRQFLRGGDINGNVLKAREVTSKLGFRDANILDKWKDHPIADVKVEVFKAGRVVAWFEFDGYDTSIENWFDKGMLMDSRYPGIPALGSGFFSIKGDSYSSRRFFISRGYTHCDTDCGYLLVVDGSFATCPWQKRQPWPYFFYGTLNHRCSRWSEEAGIGDRFVISVKMGADYGYDYDYDYNYEY